MRQHPLENRLTMALETPMIVVRSNAGTGLSRLNRAERRQLKDIRHEQRRREWLLGRAALKKLLTALGRSPDTAAVTFPDRQVSLTHGGDTAFAAGTPGAILGLGIDYEPLRKIDSRVARWFLDEKEAAWLDEQPSRVRVPELIRLWTVKEAAFKSHPDNAGMVLRAFSITDLAAPVTRVVVARTGACIRAASFAYGTGYLSVAIDPEPS